MKLTKMGTEPDWQAHKAKTGPGETVFALTATPDEASALLHDLSGTIRTFRYIVSRYGETLPEDDPQKQAKLDQLSDRLDQLEMVKKLLSPLANDEGLSP